MALQFGNSPPFLIQNTPEGENLLSLYKSYCTNTIAHAKIIIAVQTAVKSVKIIGFISIATTPAWQFFRKPRNI